MSDVTRILSAIEQGDPHAPEQLLPLVYDELRKLAAQKLELLRGELDWIVMKALDKDRNRRYETANGFALDVQRYLADEPVQACPPIAAWSRRS